MKASWIMDLEVFPSLFFCGIKDFKTKETITFEVSEYKDERKDFYRIFSKFDGYLITFNGLAYDETITSYILKEWSKLSKLSVKDFLYNVKEFSNKVIKDDFEIIKWYRWYKRNWTSIDLYMYWAKGLRISKQLSLKALAVQLNWNEIQELPYEHTKMLTKEEIEVVKRYNLVNDLGILEALFVKMKPDIELRHYVKTEYGLNCWSMDAPKIASEYLLDDFCKKTFKGDERDFSLYKKEIRSRRYIPNVWKIGDYLPNVEFKTSYFQSLYRDFCDSGPDFYRKLSFNEKDSSVLLLPSVGGIHSENDNQIWKSNEEWCIIDADVASLYPTLLDNYKLLREELIIVLDKYVNIKKDRIEAKRGGNKTKDTFLKLILNAFTGIADSDVTWVYSPEHLTALRVLGQMIQLRFIEELTLVDGIKVFFTNTDGTTCLVRKDRIDYYHKVAKSIENEFNIVWEFTRNSKMIFANTNSYISIVEASYMMDDDGGIVGWKEKKKIKRKGKYFKLTRDENGESEIPLGDSVDENVICRALNSYFVDGIDPAEYISNPDKYNLHIYDYCLSKKINKQYQVFHNNIKVQNLNRYYVSKKAPYLYKRKEGKSTFEHVNSDGGVVIFNKFIDKPWEEYEINYTYYIAKARKIIDQIQSKERQLSLF